jgi:hypothetical protein
MPAGIVVDVTPDPTPRGPSVARAEIRDSEAQRRLGLLPPGVLPTRAARWVADGVDDASVHELAEALTTTDDAREALLAHAAADLGLGFASVREARAHHGQRVVESMTAASAPTDALGFSNGFTDTIEESVRDSIARLFKPRG